MGQESGVIHATLLLGSLILTCESAELLIATTIVDVGLGGAIHLLLQKLAALLVDWLLIFACDSDQVQKLLVLLVLSNLFFNLGDFALVLSLFLLFLVDEVSQVLDLLLDLPDFLFGHVGFGLQVHFEFLVLLLVLLESFLPLVKLVLLHRDVLV